MAKVRVYQWKKWDIVSDAYIVSRRLATLSFITENGGVVEGDAIEIDESELEKDCPYTPRDYVPKKRDQFGRLLSE